MEAPMDLTRVGEEAEAVMMTDATHVAAEIVQTMEVAEMVTIIVEVVVLAHAPDLLTDTTVLETGAIAMTKRAASLEILDEMNDEEAAPLKVAKPAVMGPRL
jgi:hypothetical protein